MSIFRNLGRIIAAPVKLVDKAIVEPLGDVAEMVVDGLTEWGE